MPRKRGAVLCRDEADFDQEATRGNAGGNTMHARCMWSLLGDRIDAARASMFGEPAMAASNLGRCDAGPNDRCVLEAEAIA